MTLGVECTYRLWLSMQTMTKDYEPSDYEMVTAALAMAKAEEFTMDQIWTTIKEAKNGKEFDAGVSALVDLKDSLKDPTNIVGKYYDREE